MKKIEAIRYSFKESTDLSDVNIIRFNLNEEQHIDISLKDGKINIMGSEALKVTMTGGCNSVNIGIDNDR